MADRTTYLALITGACVCLLAFSAPATALAGGGGSSCGCTTTPTPPHKRPPSPVTVNNKTKVSVNLNVVTKVNVEAQSTASVVNQAALTGIANVSGFATTAASGFLATTGQFVGGGAAGGVAPGAVTEGAVSVGGGEEETAYEATRTRIAKVVIEAFCFDDKDVPHPASQVFPDRDVADAYDGEVFRCIAGTRMQVTIAPFTDRISFEGGRTMDCMKGEALYHLPGPGGGRLECRPQKPERDCNERSLLRRFGAGVKVLTMVITEKYTAYRHESHGGGATAMSFDGGVGGVAY